MLFLLNKEGNTPLDTAIMQGDTQKAEILINRIKKSEHTFSILRFLTKPARLELEKSFTLAVKRNSNAIIRLFPNQAVKTNYVMIGDGLTTPMHLACKISNDEGIRNLVEKQ